jgi:hypothetical protein
MKNYAGWGQGGQLIPVNLVIYSKLPYLFFVLFEVQNTEAAPIILENLRPKRSSNISLF